MRISFLCIILSLLFFACDEGGLPEPIDIGGGNDNGEEPIVLKDVFEDDFYIGIALGSSYSLLNGIYSYKDVNSELLVSKHFNAAVAENVMKPDQVQPTEGNFTFGNADNFVEYCDQNGMFITGHCLVWHSQTGDWMFENEDGTTCSREKLLKRMETHINTVVGRYKDRVHAWDVLNEAVDGTAYRKSKWYEIIGPEFIDSAYVYTHRADPDAELYYNDYNLENTYRRNSVINIIRRLKDVGIELDAVGMQSHYTLDIDVSQVEKSIEAFCAEGVDVMVTELDISVLPSPNWNDLGVGEIGIDPAYDEQYDPYPNGLPVEVEGELADKYAELFKMYLNHKDRIKRVTFWGLTDGNSWKNNYPIKGRTDYPLLFDRDFNEKLAFEKVVALK